jgi:hypothetical protein
MQTMPEWYNSVVIKLVSRIESGDHTLGDLQAYQVASQAYTIWLNEQHMERQTVALEAIAEALGATKKTKWFGAAERRDDALAWRWADTL